MTERLKRLTDWFVRGKEGKVYIIQLPNFPLVGWLLFLLLPHIITDHTLQAGFSSLSAGFLAIWSYLEITQGSSRFRRALGVLVAVGLIFTCFA